MTFRPLSCEILYGALHFFIFGMYTSTISPSLYKCREPLRRFRPRHSFNERRSSYNMISPWAPLTASKRFHRLSESTSNFVSGDHCISARNLVRPVKAVIGAIQDPAEGDMLRASMAMANLCSLLTSTHKCVCIASYALIKRSTYRSTFPSRKCPSAGDCMMDTQ